MKIMNQLNPYMKMLSLETILELIFCMYILN